MLARAAQPLPPPRPAIEHPTELHLPGTACPPTTWPPSCAPRTA